MKVQSYYRHEYQYVIIVSIQLRRRKGWYPTDRLNPSDDFQGLGFVMKTHQDNGQLPLT